MKPPAAFIVINVYVATKTLTEAIYEKDSIVSYSGLMCPMHNAGARTGSAG